VQPDSRLGEDSRRRRAIVTGADSGIGRAIAVALGARGYDVGFTWHTSSEGAKSTAREVEQHGARTAWAELDLTGSGAIVPTIESLAGRLGGLEVYVNNAGTGHTTPFLELDLETWREVLEVDLTGAFLATQTAARTMVKAGAGGRIIHITSVHEHVPLDGAAAYCAAKGGLGLLTKVMALELAEYGITVNAVAPGEIATPMTGAGDVDPHTLSRPGVPAGRPGDAREVASAVAFLADTEASYVTGHSFVVDGGMLLMAAQANRITSG
jgi:NAD(P)-dependent dehydrogenase (short-subunit alcohol dehydrogenase family)